MLPLKILEYIGFFLYSLWPIFPSTFLYYLYCLRRLSYWSGKCRGVPGWEIVPPARYSGSLPTFFNIVMLDR